MMTKCPHQFLSNLVSQLGNSFHLNIPFNFMSLCLSHVLIWMFYELTSAYVLV